MAPQLNWTHRQIGDAFTFRSSIPSQPGASQTKEQKRKTNLLTARRYKIRKALLQGSFCLCHTLFLHVRH